MIGQRDQDREGVRERMEPIAAEDPGNPPELRLAGRRLRLALEHVATTLARDLLRRPGLGMTEAFRAYADDHLAGPRARGVPSA